jgi:hypothetical protein
VASAWSAVGVGSASAGVGVGAGVDDSGRGWRHHGVAAVDDGDGDARAGVRAAAVLHSDRAWRDRGDAGSDAAAMRGMGDGSVGDGGAWDGGARDGDGGSLPPELGLCATASSSSSGLRWRRAGAARAFIPRDL